MHVVRGGWVGPTRTQTVYDYSTKGRREPILYSVPYSRRCNHDEEALYQSPAIVSARARSEQASAIDDMCNEGLVYVAAVVWVGREARLCGGYLE